MYCQACGELNRPDDEYCRKCEQKLLVVSGSLAVEEIVLDEGGDEAVSFDEHLLERISVMEEAVKRLTQTMQQALGALNKQERNILINHTGLSALREVLEDALVAGDAAHVEQGGRGAQVLARSLCHQMSVRAAVRIRTRAEGWAPGRRGGPGVRSRPGSGCPD